MADPGHIEILRHGPRVWNAWREQNPSLIPNLEDAVLSLSERQMGPVNGGPINLHSARMQRASFKFATLLGAQLESADMSEADLTHARLAGANLEGANLSCAILDFADFAGAMLTGANLSGAKLQQVQNLTQSQIKHSLCDAATIFPPHLLRPTSPLEVVRKVNATRSWCDEAQRTSISMLVGK